MEESFVFSLSKPFKYTNKDGGFSEAFSIELFPPSMLELNEGSRLSQLVVRAVLAAVKAINSDSNPEKLAEAAENARASQDDTDEAPQINSTVMRTWIMGSDIPIQDFCDAFKALAVKVGKIDENISLKQTHFKGMAYKDFMDMLFEYAANFILPSLQLEEKAQAKPDGGL